MMRYKIEYSRTKTDHWGHILPPTLSVEYAETLTEAENRAIEISSRLKKHDVNVLDMERPNAEGGSTWCVMSFKAGKSIKTNVDYFKTFEL